MRILFKFGEELFWTGFWVFLALIVGFIILSWLQARGGVVGPYAGWVGSHASGAAEGY